MKLFKGWKFNPVWIIVSTVVYTFMRINEYTTGQQGSPVWVIDFLPYILLVLFVCFDNLLELGKGESK